MQPRDFSLTNVHGLKIFLFIGGKIRPKILPALGERFIARMLQRQKMHLPAFLASEQANLHFWYKKFLTTKFFCREGYEPNPL